MPLATYALKYYKDDPCTEFIPKVKKEDICNNHEIELVSKIHKAIAMLQFKIEYEIISRHPEFEIEDRLLLDKINYNKGTVTINEVEYKLKDILLMIKQSIKKRRTHIISLEMMKKCVIRYLRSLD